MFTNHYHHSSSLPALDSLSYPSTANPASLSTLHCDPAVPAASPDNLVLSSSGTIHVISYTPSEGEPGVPISVRIHFQSDGTDPLFVRLVVGHKPIATKVRELPNHIYGRWQLDAHIPQPDPRYPVKVSLTVEALNSKSEVLDSVNFGEFSYWTSQKHRPLAVVRQPPLKVQIPSSVPETTMRRRTISARPPSKSPTSPHTSLGHQDLRIHRRMKSQSHTTSNRASNGALNGSSENLYAQTPILDLVTPLSSICAGWSTSEIQAGRRLVRFSKMHDGRRLIVSCEPIRQDEYCENDSVISCIYRQESDTCYVTSVDVIYLLERLTNSDFPVEEKNRIRRNLEGLRPTTVSKHKPGFGDFFQRIMEFPDPKPRNIEKDLKVFEWNSLGQALEKILSKYSIYSPSAPDSAESTPVETPSPEPLPPDVTDSQSSSGHASTSSSWLDSKANDFSFDASAILYESFDAGSLVSSFTHEPTSYDYSFYDSFSFNNMPDEGLGSIVDNYHV